jgi:hypothetical protein
MTNELVCRWLPVIDESGRTRMEACWVLPAVAVAAADAA